MELSGNISVLQALNTQPTKAEALNPSSKDEKRLMEVANEFETLLVKQMLGTMRESSMRSELLPEGEGEKIFRSLLDQQYAEKVVQTGDLGLGRSIYEQMKSALPEKKGD